MKLILLLVFGLLSAEGVQVKRNGKCVIQQNRTPQHLLGAFRPRCNADGTYKEVQCHEGYCFCVDKDTGTEISGTRENTRGTQPTCKKQTLTRCQEGQIQPVGEVMDWSAPECNPDGTFKEIQCLWTGYCWCADPNTGEEVLGSGKFAPESPTCGVITGDCTVNGEQYMVGQLFVPDTCEELCECRETGINCSSLCPPLVPEDCAADEEEVTVDAPAPITETCTCTRKECIKVPAPPPDVPKIPTLEGVCNVNGRDYKIGVKFVPDTCEGYCECSGAGYQCVSLCPQILVRCAKDEKEITINATTSMNEKCSCPMKQCVKLHASPEIITEPKKSVRTLEDICDVNSREYEIGVKFVPDTCSGYCQCHEIGFSCVSLCPPHRVMCAADEIVVTVNEPVGMNEKCSCPMKRCVKVGTPTELTKPKLPKLPTLEEICNVKDRQHKIGVRFVPDTCEGYCECSETGVACVSLCPPRIPNCAAGEKEITVNESVPMNEKCSCPMRRCVKIPEVWKVKKVPVIKKIVKGTCRSHQVVDYNTEPLFGEYGEYRPECDEDGNYNVVQCHKEMCFCVNPKTGVELLGTKVAGKPKICHSRCIIERHERLTTVTKLGFLGYPSPRCTENGMYDKLQCIGSKCYCADTMTGKGIPGKCD